jgi:hypothetical protein
MTAAVDIITDALIGSTIKGADETISSEDAQICLRRLKRMLDSWGNETLLMFDTNTESFTMTPNVPNYLTSLLPSGRFVSLDSIYVRLSQIDYPVEIIDQQKYQQIPYKPTPAIPAYCFYNPSYPNGEMIFYPTPYAAFECFVTSRVRLEGAITLTTDIALPDGYEKAIVDSLSEDIWTSFKGSIPVPQDVKDMARKARKVLKINNTAVLEMDTPFDGQPGDISNAFLYRGF